MGMAVWLVGQGYGYAYHNRPLVGGGLMLVKGGLYASLLAVSLADGKQAW